MMKSPQIPACFFAGFIAAFAFLDYPRSLTAGEIMDPVPLWTGTAPGEKGDIGEEKIDDKKNDGLLRLTNVTEPTLTVFQPAPEKKHGAAVIVCPGGGYSILAYSHEGTEVCEWLADEGVTAILLKYRVPQREGLPRHLPPLQDAQRATTLARMNAEAWGIDPGRIGILGFSAGGHLAAVTLTNYQERAYPAAGDAEEKVSCRPDFGILIYPAYLLDEQNPDVLSPELKITEDTPPMFILVAHDDKRFTEGCARLYIEMKRHDRPAELHIFSKGGHGFGMKANGQPVNEWTSITATWMKESGLLEPVKADAKSE